jgi:hypothetical protein
VSSHFDGRRRRGGRPPDDADDDGDRPRPRRRSGGDRDRDRDGRRGGGDGDGDGGFLISASFSSAAIFACRLKGGHGANKEQNKLR